MPKTVPIAVGITQRNYPMCTLEPSIALRPDFSCCIPRNLCLFNCPRHLTAAQAVANFGDGGGDGFSQIGSGFAQRPHAAYGNGAYDHGLAGKTGYRCADSIRSKAADRI